MAPATLGLAELRWQRIGRRAACGCDYICGRLAVATQVHRKRVHSKVTLLHFRGLWQSAGCLQSRLLLTALPLQLGQELLLHHVRWQWLGCCPQHPTQCCGSPLILHDFAGCTLLEHRHLSCYCRQPPQTWPLLLVLQFSYPTYSSTLGVLVPATVDSADGWFFVKPFSWT